MMPGGQDRLADPLDLEYLRESLGEGVVVQELNVPKVARIVKACCRELHMRSVMNYVVYLPHLQYEHLDFIWGEDAADLVYSRVIRELKSRVVGPLI